MLTREEILAMPAGHELDVLVAEKVVGMRRHAFRWNPCSRGGLYECDACGHSFCCPPWDRARLDREQIWCGSLLSVPTPRYSADVGVAWVAVSCLSPFAWCRVSTPFHPGADCWAEFDLHGRAGAERTFRAFADTLPLAVCRAALLFVLRESLRGGE